MPRPEQAALDTCFDVNFTYLSVLFGQKQLDVANKGIKNLTELKEIAQTILKEGTRSDVTTRHTDQIEIMLLSVPPVVKTRRWDFPCPCALREAMGLDSGDPLTLASKGLPNFFGCPRKRRGFGGGPEHARRGSSRPCSV